MDHTDILRITPINDVAKDCFDDLIEQKLDGTLDKHHGQYMVSTGLGILDKDYRTVNASKLAIEDESVPKVNLGYFRIGFDAPSLSGGIRWVIGRPSPKGDPRRTDILLADPYSEDAARVRSAHLFLQLQLKSGAWLLRATGPAELDDVPMETIGNSCLHKPRTDLKVFGLRFRIEFCIKTAEQEKMYLKLRNTFMSASKIPIPKTKHSGIPFESDTRLETAVFRTGLGSGSYATVFQGFSPITGGSLAIKRISIKSRADRTTVAHEIKAMKDLNGKTGIIKLHQVATPVSPSSLLPGDYPYDIHLVQDLGEDLKHYKWDREILDSPDGSLQVELLRQLLEAVHVIHRKGWMHRDITRQNIVYFPPIDAAPPRAALIDFGKVCFESSSADTCIAAWPNLPPEVVIGKNPDQGVVYDQKIDVWMLALSLARCWFPEKMLPEAIEHDQIQTTDLLNNLAELKHIPLVAILMRMLLPDPHSRSGAAELLRDSIFGTKARTANTEDLSHDKRPAGKRAFIG